MSSDHAGHLGYDRLDPEHPAHDPAQAGDELVQVYEAVDRACGELIEAAPASAGARSRPSIVLSDHGMKPIYWTFHTNRWLEENGHLRYRRPLPPAAPRAGASPTLPRSTSASRARRAGTRARSTACPLCRARRPTAPSRTSTSAPRARTPSRPAGQIFLGEASGARQRSALRRAARGRARRRPPPRDRRASLRRPAQGGALPRALPRQGPGARAPPARRAHPRRLDAPALAGGVRTPRAPRPRDLLRLFRPSRADRHPRRRRAGDRLRRRARRTPRSRSSRRRSAASWASSRRRRRSPVEDDPRGGRRACRGRAGRAAAPSEQPAYSPRRRQLLERLRDLGYE